MNFVVVNHRIPRGSARCAHCGSSIDSGYLRHLPTGRLFCDTECYLGKNEARPEPAVDLRREAFASFGI